MGLILSSENATADMESLLYSFRKAKKGKRARKELEDMLEKQKKAKERDVQKRKIAQFPPEMIFFGRVCELLQGICATYGYTVRQRRFLSVPLFLSHTLRFSLARALSLDSSFHLSSSVTH
jgi:hypothetical protein